MPEQELTVTQQRLAVADVDVLTSHYPIPGLGLIPINAFLLWSAEPVLVDTGPPILREAYFDALCSRIDPRELRWIYLTHADPDHVGCLRDVLAAAPRARVVTTFLGLGKLGLSGAIPPERVYLLNAGQTLWVGDRELVALKPPTFDAPETTAFVDAKSRALFSSDCFGGVIAEPVERAAEIPASDLRDGIVTWATVDAPWLPSVAPASFEAALDVVRREAPPMVLSSHLPPAIDMTETLLEHAAAARTAPPFVGPDQKALMATLEAVSEGERAAE